jgi:choice-of-anchor A domain-containing protein
MNNTVRHGVVALAAIVIAGISSAANLGAANDFNAVIFGNVSVQSGESEGAMAVGGSWTTQNTYQVSIHGSSPNPSIGGATNLGLYVAGAMNAGANPGSTQVNSSRNAYIGGSVAGTPTMNGGSLFANSGLVSGSFFTNQLSYSQAQSAYLAGLGGMAVDTSNSNNYKLNIANVGGVNIFEINGALLSGGKTLDILGGNGSETIIMNVLGSSVNWGTSYNGNKNNTLWNFSQATTLNINDRAIQGSVLAYGATVNQSQNIDGTLIANVLSVTNGAELHSYTFNGNAPVPEPISNVDKSER